MKRLILALLLVILAALLYPPLREPIQPEIDAGRVWLGEKLEGPMSPILTPYRRIKTESEISNAARFLIQDRNRGRGMPPAREFSDYMRRHDLEPMDGWGMPIILEQQRDSVAVISAGADLEYHTDDDIVSKLRYTPPSRRGRR